RRHLEILRTHLADYVVAEKSDGVRHLLVLGRDEEGTPFSVMVNRQLQVLDVAVSAAPSYFDGAGSVWDGELVLESVAPTATTATATAAAATPTATTAATPTTPTPAPTKTRQRFLAFDVMVCAGRSWTQEP